MGVVAMMGRAREIDRKIGHFSLYFLRGYIIADRY